MTKLEITSSQLSRHLWTRQGFDATEEPRPAAQVIEAVPGVYGAAPTCYLSVLARSPSANLAELDDLLYTQRSVVRTRAMRANLFLVAARDLPDIFQATSHLTRVAFAELVRNAGLDADAYKNAAARIEAALEAAPLTLAEIRQALPDLPANVEAALNYVVGLMCGEGRLIRAGVRGGWKSDITEYARLRDWLPGVDLGSGDAERGRVLLARRYFHAFGPASADDFHWWSGLPREDADAAVAALRAAGAEVTEVAAPTPGRAVIIAVYADIRGWKGRAGLSERAVAAVADALEAAPDATVVLFGHPRLAAELPATAAHVLAAWGGEQLMQEAAARRLAAERMDE